MKTQMKFQKILSLVTLVLAALTFVLGVMFCSGIISESRIYTSAKMPYDRYNNRVTDMIGADALYDYTQKANDVLVIMAIVFILVAVVIYITATNKRRNYYVTNYVAIGLVVAYALAFAIVLFVICGKSAALAGQIDMAKWSELVSESSTDRYGNVSYYYPQNYSDSYGTIIIGFILAVAVLVDIAAWVLNTLWKFKLMKGEKGLLVAKAVEEVS